MADFMVKIRVVNAAGKQRTRAEVEYNDVPDQDMPKLIQMSDGVLRAAERAQNKGGDLTMELTRTAPGADGSKSFAGVTWDGVNDVEDELDKHGKTLKQMGREHAKNKGKHGHK